jgi:hypothetical protein
MKERGIRMFENMVLKNVSGCMMEKEMGESHNGELCAFYSLPSTIQVIQSRIMGCTDGWGMWHLWDRGKACTRFWW